MIPDNGTTSRMTHSQQPPGSHQM